MKPSHAELRVSFRKVLKILDDEIDEQADLAERDFNAEGLHFPVAPDYCFERLHKVREKIIKEVQ